MHRRQIPWVGNLWLIKQNCIILICKVFIPALAWDTIYSCFLMSTHFFFFNFELKHKNLNAVATVAMVDRSSYKANNHTVVTIC